MLKAGPLRILAILIGAYTLLLLPAAFAPSYLDSPFGLFLAAPLLSVYLFHKLGIPGLLEHDGLCGWGWCSPTVFGWVFVATIWLTAAWLLAGGIAALTSRRVKG